MHSSISLLVTLLILTFEVGVSCASSLTDIIHRDTLIVGTSGEFPPFSALNQKGEIVGFDIEITQLIAQALGVEYRVKKYPFDQLLTALNTGKIDIVASGMSITAQRNIKALFVGPYYSSGKSLLTKDYNLGLSSTDAAENSVVVVEGTTSQVVAKKLFTSSKIIVVTSFDEGLKLLLAGEVTAILADYPFCVVTSYRYREEGVSTPKEPFTYEPIGFALTKDAYHFANWLQNYLIILEGEGVLGELNNKWFKDMSWVDSLRE